MSNDSENAGSMSRRAALGVLGAGALGAGLWPRSPRSRANIPFGRTVIEYWEKWTGPEGDAIQAVVDRFNASQSRIWVRRVPISEIDTKAMVAIGGGDPPDVAGVFSYNVPQYAQSGAAMALDDFAPSPDSGARSGIDPAIYAPAVQKLLSFNGRLWAGISSCYSLALYYNRAMFKEAGLDPEKPPRTIPELDAAADRLLIRERTGPISRAGFLQNLPSWWPYFWPCMFGGRLYDEANDRAIFADEATIAAYEWVGSYPKRLGATESRSFSVAYNTNFHSPQDPFISGKVAMIVQGPWMANFIARYNPGLDYAAAPVPVAESLVGDACEPIGMLEADVLIIPRGCKHPEEAFEFVQFTQRQDVQESLATSHCKSSPLAACSPGFLVNHPNRSVAVFDSITKSPRVQILPQTPVWKSYAHLTEGAFDAVWNGGGVTEICTQVERRAQAMLDKAARVRALRATRASTNGRAGVLTFSPNESEPSLTSRERSERVTPAIAAGPLSLTSFAARHARSPRAATLPDCSGGSA